MGRVPIAGHERLEKKFIGGTAQIVFLDIGSEKWFLSQEGFDVAMSLNASRPVVREKDVDGVSDL